MITDTTNPDPANRTQALIDDLYKAIDIISERAARNGRKLTLAELKKQRQLVADIRDLKATPGLDDTKDKVVMVRSALPEWFHSNKNEVE